MDAQWQISVSIIVVGYLTRNAPQKRLNVIVISVWNKQKTNKQTNKQTSKQNKKQKQKQKQNITKQKQNTKHNKT